jgi:hypothetical protein
MSKRSILRRVRRAARDDLASFADDLRSLERAGASPAAAEPYRAALAAYEWAERACDRARSPADLHPVAAALERGRYDLARAQALVDEREEPVRTPPCFFDPRHGPAVREVEWSVDAAMPRRVTACAADAERLARGAEPDTRHVMVDGRPVPYWDAPPEFRPWVEGYYGTGPS